MRQHCIHAVLLHHSPHSFCITPAITPTVARHAIIHRRRNTSTCGSRILGGSVVKVWRWKFPTGVHGDRRFQFRGYGYVNLVMEEVLPPLYGDDVEGIYP